MRMPSHWAAVYVVTLIETLHIGLVVAGVPKKIHLNLTSTGYVESPSFPTCCSSYNVSLEWDNEDYQGFIRLGFSDLDLPKGSKLRVYHGSTGWSKALFDPQPQLRDGMWTRPFYSTTEANKDSILINFIPQPAPASEKHVGFRAHYYVENSVTWYEKPTSELCPPVSSALGGGRVKVKPSLLSAYRGRLIECVWQLKIPEMDSGASDPGYQVYARFTQAQTDEGEIIIRKGISSLGDVISRAADLGGLMVQPSGITSDSGLYISVTMKADEIINRVIFIYGVFKETANTGDCSSEFGDLGGFYCLQDKWCIPSDNRCNGAVNCPNGEDEEACAAPSPSPTLARPAKSTSRPPTTTTTRPTATTTTTRARTCGLYETLCPSGECVDIGNGCDGCTIFEKKCPDGTCVSVLDDCDGCPGLQRKCPDGHCIEYDRQCNACGLSEKKCPDGRCIRTSSECNGCPGYKPKKCNNGNCVYRSSRCSEDSCPSYQAYTCDSGRTCYSHTDKCDGSSDCNDGTDEYDCSSSGVTDNLYYIILIPAMAIFIIIGCCRWMKRTSQSSSQMAEQSITSPAITVIVVIVVVVVLCCICTIIVCGKRKQSRRRAANRQGNARTAEQSITSPAITVIVVIVVVVVLCCVCTIIVCGKRKQSRRRAANRQGNARTAAESVSSSAPIVIAVIVVLIVLCLIVSAVMCHKRQQMRQRRISRGGNAQPEENLPVTSGVPAPVTDHTMNYSGTRMQPVLPSAHAGYSPVATVISPPSIPPPPAATPSAPLPPSYDDVMTTGIYNPPESTTAGNEQPPSYDSYMGSTIPS